MPTVIGVRFRRAGRLFYYDPDSIPFQVEDLVLVEARSRTELARVILASTEVDDTELRAPLRKVTRRATEQDRIKFEEQSVRATEAMARFKQIIGERGLPIKPIKANWSFDGATLTFNIAASGQVDFSELAGELAGVFHARIELRQVGSRERAALVDGLGRCGLSLCCSSWLVEPGRVSVRMAKNQNLPLNPAKISGVCGRLLCCLRYEHEMYVEGAVPQKPANPDAGLPEFLSGGEPTPIDDQPAQFYTDEPETSTRSDGRPRRTRPARSRRRAGPGRRGPQSR